MPMYRRKTAQLRAVVVERESWGEAQKAEKKTDDQILLIKVSHQANRGFFLETASGPVSVGVGDYIACRGTSEVQAIKKENFEELYEPCEEEMPEENLREKAARLLAERQGK